MTPEEIETIGRLADMLRAKGVRVCDVSNNIRLELEPTQAPPSPKQSVDPDICPCGHPEFAHTNGLCIHGCEAGQCEEKKVP